MFTKIQKFFSEVVLELKKVSWTTKKELIDSTWIVIISSLILGVFVGVMDLILSGIMRLIIS